MNRLLTAVVATIALVVAAIAVWVVFIREEAPEAFELTPDQSAEQSPAGDPAAEAGEAAGTAGLDGHWVVGEGSEAGYRVVEDLGDLLDLEAVGRTSTVAGSFDIEGTQIASGSFEVDVASISSDDGRRDTQFRDRVMSTGQFPTATFVLTAPIELGELPAEGSPVVVDGAGELTLRGVTNPATASIQAQLIGGRIEVVGSIPVLFSDYEIANPSNPLVEVRDEGLVEVRLLVSRGG